MMKPRISLFAEQEGEDRRAKLGDPLVGLVEHVDFDALAARIDAAAPFARQGRPSAVSDSLDDQDPGAVTALQPGRRRAAVPVAGPTWLPTFPGSDREQRHPRCQDDLAVPRPSGAGWRRQSGVRAGSAAAAVAGLPGALRTDRRRLAGTGVGPAQQGGAETVKEGTMPLGWKPHKRARKDVDAMPSGPESTARIISDTTACQCGQALQADPQDRHHACCRGRHYYLRGIARPEQHESGCLCRPGISQH